MEDRTLSSKTRALERAVGSGALMESLPIGVYCCDHMGIVRHFNRHAAELWGRAPEAGERFGAAHRLFLPDGTPLTREEAPIAEVLRTAEPVRDQRFILERPDGTRIDVKADVEPLFDEDGTFVGVVNCFQDITARSKAEIEAAHLAAIVSSSSDAIVSKTLDGIVQSWNAGAARIFGWQPDEIVGRPITTIIPPELHHQEDEILSQLRRGERIEHFETERVTKDGRRIDVSLTVSPVYDQSGRIIGASKVARDVTDRKRAERLQRLLIRELNHRVKNTLATVQSIANQTVRHARSPAEAEASFSGRIQALADAHDLLTRNSWQGADLRWLAQGQLLLHGAEDDRISFSGPSLTLDPQPALHLALILHELGTNARKYGSLSVLDGQLAVEWTVRSSGNGSHLLLTWRESGGPVVEVPAERGFGTALIERSLATHGGEVSIDYRAEGVACDIMLPIPERPGAERDVPAGPALPTPRPAPQDHPVDAPAVEAGRRVLVVEDEALIAMDIAATLAEMGCIVVGPASTLEAAEELVAQGGLDAALLDANLAGRPVEPVAAALARSGVPFAFLTGYGRESLPEAFREAPLVTKPFTHEDAVAVIARLTARGDAVPARRKEG